MSLAHIIAEVTLGVLVANGLRVVIGLPPVAYWFRSRSCPTCNGVGHVKRGRALLIEISESRAREPEAASPLKEKASSDA